MTVIYKRISIARLYESSKVNEYKRGTKYNLCLRRCAKCHAYYECDKKYQTQICSLCKMEMVPEYKERLLKQRGITFEEYFEKARKKHFMLERGVKIHLSKDGCVVKNSPICTRFENLSH